MTAAQEAASATLILKLRDSLDADQYAKITAEIQNNGAAHPINKERGGKFDELQIEQYIGNFEDIGYLVQERGVAPEMAYHHFSYDVEKAWCNDDVQRAVQAAQHADKSSTAASDPMFGNFEKLATDYLKKENQTCKDLNNQ